MSSLMYLYGNRTSRPADHSAQDHSARVSGLLGPCDRTTLTVRGFLCKILIELIKVFYAKY